MSKILEQLTVARTKAMKAKIGATGDALDAATLELDTLRGVIGEIEKDAKLSNARTELTVLKGEYSKRVASAKLYAEIGETDRSEREAAEADILAQYLPRETSEAELQEFIVSYVAENELAGKGGRALGSVMGALKSQFESYDAKLASQLAREAIG